MVIINMFGKIEPICISQKMGLYISNLPNDEDNNWNAEIVEEFKQALKLQEINCETIGVKNKIDLKELHQQRVKNVDSNIKKPDDELIQEIVDNMICIYFDYSYDDMPLGGWDENPFDGRLCEEDYAEIIVNFFNFISYRDETKTPQWIYSSNYDAECPYYRMFWGQIDYEEQLASLVEWGKKLDSFLVSRNDYLQIDYIARALHDAEQCDTYHFFKLFSLCQMFLEKEEEKELDYKLPQFLGLCLTEEKVKQVAELLRQMRNKIAHGDFVAFEKKAEKYAQLVMDSNYNFDYSEYSRKNWVLLHACCLLSDAVRKMIVILFKNREDLERIKESTK